MRRRSFLILFVIGITLACQQEPTAEFEHAQQEPQMVGAYRAALPWSPRDLDPAFSTDIYSVTLIQQIFDGLVQFDQNLNVVPALASNWQVSDDGLSYNFAIRQDAKFHNGREVTAEDFIYSFTRILDPRERASALSFFERIEGASLYRSGISSTVSGLKAIDAHSLRISLKEPFAPFLSVLAMKSSKVVPREEIEAKGKDFGRHPVGTGPFRLESWEGDEIVLSANPDYFEGRPSLDRVVYKIYPGAQHENVFDEFLEGRLEEAFVIGASRDRMSQTTIYQYYRKPSLSLMFYGMNCGYGPLRDRRVRQAINWAIDKNKIIREVFKDQFIPADTILPPGLAGYTPENKIYGFSPEKAKALLAEAGYGSSKERLSLRLLSASQSNVAQKELAMVAGYLADVGIQLQIEYETDWPTFEAAISKEGLQMYRYAWFADIPDPDNFLNILCGSESRYNFMKYHNTKVSRLLSEALVETDLMKRVNLYREAERFILMDAPMVPFMYLTFESVFQPYVRGLAISLLGRPYIPLKKIWLEYQ